MKIKIGNFNFINDKENKLSSYYDIQYGMEYFYLDGKEDTLFVSDKSRIDNVKLPKYDGYYEYERKILEKYAKIVDYNEEIRKIIEEYINEKIIDKFIRNDYSRYNLYNNINFDELLRVKEYSQFNFRYGEDRVIDFDKNRIYKGEFIFNPYTNEIENLDQIYEQGRFNNIIKAGLIKLEIENNKAPDFVYSVLKMNEFFRDKQTVNVLVDGYEKFKASASINHIFSIRDNQIKFDLGYNAGKSFTEVNPNADEREIKTEQFQGLTYGKNMLEVDGMSLCNLKEQISVTLEDKLHFRIDELKEELHNKYYSYKSEFNDYSMPYSISDAFLNISKIEKDKYSVGAEYPEWYSEEVKQILDDYVSLKKLENMQTLDDLKEVLKKFYDKELQSIYYSLKFEDRKTEDIEGEELNEE